MKEGLNFWCSHCFCSIVLNREIMGLGTRMNIFHKKMAQTFLNRTLGPLIPSRVLLKGIRGISQNLDTSPMFKAVLNCLKIGSSK